MRLTKRDEYGTVDIVLISEKMQELYKNLSFDEANALTDEDEEEEKKIKIIWRK